MRAAGICGITMALALGTGSAEAAVMSIAPGTGGLTFGAVPTAGSNQALPVLFGIPAVGSGYGWYGAVVTGSPAATYTYDVFGAEAGFFNHLSVDGAPVYTHTGGNNLSLTSKATYTGSTLNFSFLTNTSNSGSPPSTLVTNDLSATGNTNNAAKSLLPNYFASFDLVANSAGTTPLSGDVLWLFLDDGNQVDDNHDDLVVRITATVVPVPPALWLFGSAVGLLGVARRKMLA